MWSRPEGFGLHLHEGEGESSIKVVAGTNVKTPHNGCNGHLSAFATLNTSLERYRPFWGLTAADHALRTSRFSPPIGIDFF